MRNVPKLRFKEFNGEWEEKKLGEISNFLDGKRKPLKDSDRNNRKGIYPYYGASGIIDYIDDYIFDKELILLGEDGANILTRNTRLAFLATGKYWVNNHAHVIEGKKYVNQYFLCEYLEKLDYTQYNTGTAQPKLNQEICKNILVKLPYLKEQEKIGNFLSNIDKKISITEEKLDLFKEYKKGIMQKIFKQELRFKDSKGNDYPEWEEKRLGEIIEFLSDYTANGSFASLKENVTYYTEENYAVLVRTTDLEKRIFTPERFTDKKGYNFLKKTALFGGEIILANVGSIGNVYKVPSYNKPMTLAPNTYVIYFNTLVEKEFIYQMMKTNNFKNKILSKVGSSTLKAINKANLKDIDIFIPTSLEEQQKIANFLSSIDNKIENLATELENLKEFKKGLLQQMFV